MFPADSARIADALRSAVVSSVVVVLPLVPVIAAIGQVIWLNANYSSLMTFPALCSAVWKSGVPRRIPGLMTAVSQRGRVISGVQEK